jgi:hypothetical protein
MEKLLGGKPEASGSHNHNGFIDEIEKQPFSKK